MGLLSSPKVKLRLELEAITIALFKDILIPSLYYGPDDVILL